jgi:D-cysteine desulfhydrase family pyridoxal phosphate-dependent enzyme
LEKRQMEQWTVEITFPERVRFAHLPTPLDELEALRAALGGAAACPRILIKRDDLTGFAFGGNKVRKLEFLVADAQAKGVTVVITGGAAQSNHARATAAAARKAGLKAVLVLEASTDRPPEQGNLLLDRLVGAETRIVPDGTDMDAAMAAVADELTARGEQPYVIPIGGSSALGVMGYVAASIELAEQLAAAGETPSRLYYANGSRGTQAGLVLGAKVARAPYRPVGIAVSGGDEWKRPKAMRIANEAAELLGAPERVGEEDLVNDEGYIGPGYGVLTDGCVQAISLLARTEGIFLDPVYSGKAMAGLIDHVRTGKVGPDETVVFLHTGGTPALFARADELMERIARQ